MELMLQKVKEKLEFFKSRLAKIPPEYRRWSTFGILFALLVALPITIWGLTSSGSFELRKRAATGEITPTPIPTSFGKAALFTRGNNYIVIDAPSTTNGSVLNPKGPITVETWVKFNENIPPSESIFFLYKWADYNYPRFGKTRSVIYYLQFYQDRFTFRFNDTSKQLSGGASFSLPPGVLETDWHHVAGVYDGQSVKLFIDGKLMGSSGGMDNAFPLIDDNLPLLVPAAGNAPTSGDFSQIKAPPMTIDEIRISNMARYSLNFAPPSGPFSPDNNTLLLWHLDGSELLPEGDRVVRDASQNKKDGVVVGPVEFVDSNIPRPTIPTPTPTCPSVVCDINGDGKENTQDGNFITGCWRKSSPLGECQKVDVNCDGTISIIDIQRFSYRCPHIFSTTTSTPAPQPTPILRPTATPTPTPTLAPTPTPTPLRWWRLKLPRFSF